jgi:hypothetical protein
MSTRPGCLDPRNRARPGRQAKIGGQRLLFEIARARERPMQS